MLFNANDRDRSRFAREFDVCVIGSGPAGITLARSLAGQGLSVALMEAGDLEFTPESQDHYVGENAGLDYMALDAVRLRYFGGTSGHWRGTCRVLDAHDFTPRSYNPLSGWPIAKADLDPYQPAAAAILDLAAPQEGPDLPVAQSENRFRRTQWRGSNPPTRFGEKYRDEIVAAERIALCLNANLVDLELADDLGTVTGAVFKSYAPGDPGFTVRARAYALCTGAIENARLLLNFCRQMPNGIGNDHDLVGRYFCEHPFHEIASLVLAERPATATTYFSPTLEFMERAQVLNFVLRLVAPDLPAQSFADAAKAAAQCLNPFTHRLAEAVLGKATSCRVGGIDEYRVRHDPAGYPYGRVIMATEQSLRADSRVMLAETADGFGLMRARLDWRLGEIDYRTMRTAAMALAAHVAEQNIGRMRLQDWLLAERIEMPNDGGHMNGSFHHMCTTRMSDDPRTGVVDRNCRVHGLANLHIGGASVFATPGYANPTHTIVQLALRLGEHLGRELQA